MVLEVGDEKELENNLTCFPVHLTPKKRLNVFLGDFDHLGLHNRPNECFSICDI